MLRHLHIRNLAVIDALDLNLGPGFNVLTGETGAGKSILIDAVGLALGSRADGALVRSSAEQAEVVAEFDLQTGDSALDWLEAQQLADVDEPGRCLIRRLLKPEGRSRAFVNDRPVTLGALQGLGNQLVEIFGQGESRTLVQPEIQRALVDAYGVETQTLRAVAAAAGQWRQIEEQITRLRAAGERDPAQLAFARFQLEELDALALEEDELESLDAEHRRLANAGQLLEDGNQAIATLYGEDGSVYDQLATVSATLESLMALDPGFSTAVELTTGAQAQLREVADLLRGHLDRVDLDPQRLQTVEERLAAIQDLARKHRLRAAELPARREALRQELEQLEHNSERLAGLEQTSAEIRRQYAEHAEQLSRQRHTAAQKLSGEVTKNIRALGMANAVFEIAIDHVAADRPNLGGNDRLAFTFTANPGQPPRPLARVASGGELSRISLALQVTLRRAATVPTMIFDEIDAGIGGGVAEIVGQQLQALGQRSQVLCVTHLAQVAAQGQQHFHISKRVKDQQTFTRVETLDQVGRVAELARMSGGRNITATTEAHARELLDKGQKPDHAPRQDR